MYFYSYCALVSVFGLLQFGSVFAVPLGGIPGLDDLAGITGGSNGNGNGNGQPSLPAANPLAALAQLGGLGNVAELDINGLLSGLNLLPRDTSGAEYINSAQISTEGSCNGEQYTKATSSSSNVFLVFSGNGSMLPIAPVRMRNRVYPHSELFN
jgi:hypothetical protein